ncbi:MAG: hypothetical protein RSB38_06535 [Oscillospiraceae bacterium]
MVIGNINTATFEKWWLEKIGIYNNHFTNDAMFAGTYYEHKILDSLWFPVEKDKQVILEDLKLRINLDGNTEDTIYEVKTYNIAKQFKVPIHYKRQVWVQMFGTGIRKAFIVAYGLKDNDYDNIFNPIEEERIEPFEIEYNEQFITETYLPRLMYLSKCLSDGVFPCEI